MQGLPSVARCQNCLEPTSRKCSACNVCIYCSSNCEAKAAQLCFADVACKLHLALPYEDTNLGNAAAHILMLPSTQTDLAAHSSPQLRWTALHNAAVHYLHILLACSPSRLTSKTAFGMAIVLTPKFSYSCGCQRIHFPVGKTSQAAAKIVGNMGQLALAQLGAERAHSPRLRDEPGARDERQAVIVSGFVAESRNDASYVVHFDCIYVTHLNNAWTVRRVQPLWQQKLTPVDDKVYTMAYRPDGHVPSHERPSLSLLEPALNPPELAPAPTPILSPTRPLSTPSQVRLPPSLAEKEVGQAAAQAQQSPHVALKELPPTAQWSEYQSVAMDRVEAQEEAPPWLAHVEAALKRA